jgi:hypothetical protein
MNQRRTAQLGDLHLSQTTALTCRRGEFCHSSRVTMMQWCLEIDDFAECSADTVQIC